MCNVKTPAVPVTARTRNVVCRDVTTQWSGSFNLTALRNVLPSYLGIEIVV